MAARASPPPIPKSHMLDSKDAVKAQQPPSGSGNGHSGAVGRAYPSNLEVKLQAIDRIQTQVHLDRGALESCSRELQLALADIRALKLSYNSLVEEVQAMNQFAADARAEIVGIKQEIFGAGNRGPSQPGERMDDKALEMLSANLAVVSSKTNEVDSIKVAIELMKRRLTRLEETSAHQPTSNQPHASPSNTTPDSHAPPAYAHAASQPPEARQEQAGEGGWASVNQTGGGKRPHVNGVDPNAVGGDASPSKRPRLAPLEPRRNYDGAAPASTRYDPTRHDVEEQPQAYRRTDSGESHPEVAYAYAEHEAHAAAAEDRRRSVSGPTAYSPASHSPGGGRGRGRGGRPRKYLAPDRSSWLSSRGEGTGRQAIVEGHIVQQGHDGQWYPVDGSRRSSLAGPPQTLPSSGQPPAQQQHHHQARQPSVTSIAAAAVAAANASAVGPMGAGHAQQQQQQQQQHHHHQAPLHHDPRAAALSHHHHHAAASGAPPPRDLSAAQRDAYAAAAAHANSLKKTRAKPFRNADGVLIRKDGRPDMRSHSSAANLRKVHARKEEERRSGGGSVDGHGGGHEASGSRQASYAMRADDSVSAASTPQAMRHDDDDDDDDERHEDDDERHHHDHHHDDDERERYDEADNEDGLGRRRSSSAAAEKMMRQLYPHGIDVERRAGGASSSAAASAGGTPRRYVSHREESVDVRAAAAAAAAGGASSNGGTPRSSVSAASPMSGAMRAVPPPRKPDEERRRLDSVAGVVEARARSPAGERMDIGDMKELVREIKERDGGGRRAGDALEEMRRDRAGGDEDMGAPMKLKLERGPEAVGVHGE